MRESLKASCYQLESESYSRANGNSFGMVKKQEIEDVLFCIVCCRATIQCRASKNRQPAAKLLSAYAYGEGSETITLLKGLSRVSLLDNVGRNATQSSQKLQSNQIVINFSKQKI